MNSMLLYDLSVLFLAEALLRKTQDELPLQAESRDEGVVPCFKFIIVV